MTDNLSKLQALGINVKSNTGTEPQKTTCPKCSHTRRKNKNEKCLRVWVETGTYYCHHCGDNGSVAEYETEYEIPTVRSLPISDKIINFFKERGINEDTIGYYGVTEGTEYMPQVQSERAVIQFNYIRKGRRVNIKFRDAEKNFKLNKGSELIMYGLDVIKDSSWCIITEGEFDAMAFYEAGLQQERLMFACSVPNGASTGNQNLTYLDNSINEFENKEKIYLALDNDAPGIKLRDELSRRIGKDRIWLVNFPEGCKDANDVLLKHGSEVLVKCIDSAKPFPLEGVSKASDSRKEIHNLYNYGMPQGDTIGYNNFDKLMSWRPSEFTLVTGVPGHGKSSFVDQVVIELAKKGWKFGVFSAEKQPIKVHVAELIEKYAGKKFGRGSVDNLQPEELDPAIDFINKHFFFINLKDNDLTVEGILNKGKELVKKMGINCLIIDNWAFVEHKIERGMNEHQYTGLQLSKIKIFKEAYDCGVMLVAHPQKLKKENGKVEVASGYSVSGSSHFFNKVDNGITVYRDFEKELVEVHVWKVRWRFTGKTGMQEFKYNLDTTCYSEYNNGEIERQNTQFPTFKGQ
jgi:twinkle protein